MRVRAWEAALVVASIALCACGAGGHGVTSARRTVVAKDLDVPGRAKIRSPYVRGTIAGKEALFLIDTGAAIHAVAGWAVEDVRGERQAARATDGTGAPAEAGIIDLPAVELDGWGPVPAARAVVVPFPPLFEELRLAGVLSPQWLAADGRALLVDFPSGTMVEIAAADAESALGAGRRLTRGKLEACVAPSPVITQINFIVDGIVGETAARLTIDTGSETRLFAGSAAGRMLAGPTTEAKQTTVTGTTEGRVIQGAAMRVGEVATTADVLIVPGGGAPACPSDGAIGFDVLRSCRLVVARSFIAAVCGE